MMMSPKEGIIKTHCSNFNNVRCFDLKLTIVTMHEKFFTEPKQTHTSQKIHLAWVAEKDKRKYVLVKIVRDKLSTFRHLCVAVFHQSFYKKIQYDYDTEI